MKSTLLALAALAILSACTTTGTNTGNGIDGLVAQGPSAIITPEDTPVDMTLNGTTKFALRTGTEPGSPDENPIEILVQTWPLHGVLDFEDGRVPVRATYIPDPDFSGGDSLIFIVTNATGLESDPVTVEITILPDNDRPVALPAGPFETLINHAVEFSITGEDTEDPADALSILVVSSPAHGTLTPGAGFAPLAMTYEPVNGYSGLDEFIFAVVDNEGAISLPETVVIAVAKGPEPVGLKFASSPQSITAGECSSAVTVQTRNLLGNAVNVSTPLKVNLTGPPSAAFFNDALCTKAVTTLTIGAGKHYAIFYFTDTLAGIAAYTASDASNVIEPASQDETIIHAAPARLTFGTLPNSIQSAGIPWHSFSVRVEDAFGNLATGDNLTLVSLTGSDSSELLGTTTQRAVNGIATFSDVVYTTAEMLHIGAISSPALESPACVPVWVIATTPHHLAFGIPPAGYESVNEPWAPFTVMAMDAYENPVTLVKVWINARISSGSGTLSGTTAVPVSKGTATFSDLNYNKSEKVTLSLFSDGLTGTEASVFVLDDDSPAFFIQAVSGVSHNCALATNGRVKCWGYNADGEVGQGISGAAGDPVGSRYIGDSLNETGDNLPWVDLGNGRSALTLAAGSGHTCAILDNHKLKCWGHNTYGQLGLGDAEARGDNPGEMGDNLPIVDLGADHTAKAIAAGNSYTCAILDDGSLKCWGLNNYGQLGVGNTNTRYVPTAVPLGEGRTAVTISTGSSHTCAILDDGTLKCWGRNEHGQLGLGDTEDHHIPAVLPPVRLGTGRRATQVAASGSSHTCALLDNAQVKCWGGNWRGELGLGDTSSRGVLPEQMGDNLPAVNLGADATAVAIFAGGHHTTALLEDGHIKSWGENFYGVLGQGDTRHRGTSPGDMGDSLPAIDLGSDVIALDIAGTGSNHQCALLDTGSIKCWGYNANGQLAQGDSLTRGDSPGEMGNNLLPAKLGHQ